MAPFYKQEVELEVSTSTWFYNAEGAVITSFLCLGNTRDVISWTS